MLDEGLYASGFYWSDGLEHCFQELLAAFLCAAGIDWAVKE